MPLLPPPPLLCILGANDSSAASRAGRRDRIVSTLVQKRNETNTLFGLILPRPPHPRVLLYCYYCVYRGFHGPTNRMTCPRLPAAVRSNPAQDQIECLYREKIFTRGRKTNRIAIVRATVPLRVPPPALNINQNV